MSFNPQEKLINLPRRKKDGDSWVTVDNWYLETRYRLMWLHDANPDAEIHIETQMVEHDPGKYAVFKTTVVIGNRSATGWATKAAGGQISYLENCETHSLGRALAALGYGTAWCDDFAEGSDAEGVTPVDSPVQRPATSRTTPQRLTPMREAAAIPRVNAATTGQLLTEPQKRAIYAVASNVNGWKEHEIEAWCMEQYGVLPEALNRSQASAAIDKLKLGVAS